MQLLWIAEVLRSAGLTVVEHPGWKTHSTGSTWTPEFGVVHATAAPRAQPDSVQVDVVRDGRADLHGPIANCVVDRAGRWHVVAAGRCNTTLVGTAGPYKGLGNTYALGVEGCNNNLDEPWPPAQYQSYVHGWAALLRRLGWGAHHLVGHKEHTPGHKTDPTFDMARFRTDVTAVLAGEDDHVTNDDIEKIARRAADLVKQEVWSATFGNDATEARFPGSATTPLTMKSYVVRAAMAAKDATRGVVALAAKDQVDENALAASLVPLLTGDQLEAVIRAGMTAEERKALAARLAL